MNMSGVSGGSGMASMAGHSDSHHSKVAGGSAAATNEKGAETAQKGQVVSLDDNLGKKVDFAV